MWLRPPDARRGNEEWLSVINGNEVSSKGKADATTGGGPASERASEDDGPVTHFRGGDDNDEDVWSRRAVVAAELVP